MFLDCMKKINHVGGKVPSDDLIEIISWISDWIPCAGAKGKGTRNALIFFYMDPTRKKYKKKILFGGDTQMREQIIM
jgi:hypothetical protein